MKNIQEVINNYKKSLKHSYSEIIDGKKIIDLAKEKSIKEERSLLKTQICEAACNYVNKYIEICNKFNFTHTKFDSEISHTRGNLSVTDIDLEEKEIYLNYTDHWAYGGHCDVDFSITINELIDFNEKDFINQKVNEKIKEYNSQIKSHVNQILNNKKLIEELKQEYNIETTNEENKKTCCADLEGSSSFKSCSKKKCNECDDFK